MDVIAKALQSDTWVIGVVLALVADVLSNTGTNLQKLAHTQIQQRKEELIEQRRLTPPKNKSPAAPDEAEVSPLLNEEEEDSSAASVQVDEVAEVQVEASAGGAQVEAAEEVQVDEKSGHYCASPTWLLGIGLLVSGALADFVALIYASQSIVSPLGSLTLVVNLILARWMHGEVITRMGVVATLFIVAGSFMTVLFANHSELNLDMQGIVGLYFTIRFGIYALVVTVSLTCLWIFAVYWGKRNVPEDSTVYPMYRLAIAALNGTLGGHNVLFAKLTVELISRGGISCVHYPMFYVTIFMLVLTIVTQISWLNEGLRRFDAIFMIPVSTSFWVFFSAFSGIVTTGEYLLMSWSDITLFSTGMLLIIIGVLIFTRNKSVVCIDDEQRKSFARRSSHVLRGSESGSSSSQLHRSSESTR